MLSASGKREPGEPFGAVEIIISIRNPLSWAEHQHVCPPARYCADRRGRRDLDAFCSEVPRVLGASAFIIGAYDGLKTLLGAVYAYPGGIAVDRWGHRTALMSFTGISIAGYLLVLAIPH
jgi:hypothetical protein